MKRPLTHNTAEVRKLIGNAFSVEELLTFCYDHFPGVYSQTSVAMTKTMLAQLLIEHCYRYGEVDQLLALIKEKNPYQFSRYLSSRFSGAASTKRLSSNTAVVEFKTISEVSFGTLTEEQLEGLGLAMRGVLAGVLGIPVEEVILLEMREGSVIYRVEIPADSLRKLLEIDGKTLSELLGVKLESVLAESSQDSPRSEPSVKHSEPSEKKSNAFRGGGTVKLYVGNLPFDTDEEQIRELFSPYGKVLSVDMIFDRDTKRFRGFCFVAMDKDEAEAATQALDGYSFDGRPLKVNNARPREHRPDSGNYGPSGGRYFGRRRGSDSSNRG